MKKKMLLAVGMIFICVIATCGCAKKTPKPDGILGEWYEFTHYGTKDYIFYDDNTYVISNDSWSKKDQKEAMKNYYTYKYDKEKKTIFLSERGADYSVILDGDHMKLDYSDHKDTYELYRDPETAKKESPYYYTSDEYFNTFVDKDGYCIKDGVLYAYMGKETEITIPEGVKEIYSNALAGDCKHGVNLKKVTVPGTVKKIDKGAFMFTEAEVIVIKEGVKEIGENAFGDSYIDEIWFPASLEKIGWGIMETEEGLAGTRIHVPKDSKISRYFKKEMPYGDSKLIYE